MCTRIAKSSTGERFCCQRVDNQPHRFLMDGTRWGELCKPSQNQNPYKAGRRISALRGLKSTPCFATIDVSNNALAFGRHLDLDQLDSWTGTALLSGCPVSEYVPTSAAQRSRLAPHGSRARARASCKASVSCLKGADAAAPPLAIRSRTKRFQSLHARFPATERSS